MLVLIRSLLTVAWFWCFSKLATESAASPLDLGLAALILLMSVAIGLVWAPVVGEWVARPLTNVLTAGNYEDCGDDFGMSLIRHFEREGDRRGVIGACLLLIFLHPERSVAYMIGMEHSLPGTRLERWFASRLYERSTGHLAFSAYQVLIRHKVEPPKHHDPAVNLLIFSLNLTRPASHPPVPLPSASPPVKLKRDTRIKLFEAADQPPPSQPEPPSIPPVPPAAG